MPGELRCEGLTVRAGGRVILEDVSFRIPAGELVAVAGPSGAGKSTLGRALVGLVRADPGGTSGEIHLRGAPSRHWRAGEPAAALHGAGLAWTGQDPWAGLSPFTRVGAALRRAGAASPTAALAQVGLPGDVARAWPHTLSGGMARRAAIALALAGAPRFLVADEPTAGLDPTIAEDTLALLRAVADGGVGVLVLGHDVRVLRRHASRIGVVENGRLRETVAADEPFATPAGIALDEAAEGPPWTR
jgi:peptide/nickel transport system ATP-binding protein